VGVGADGDPERPPRGDGARGEAAERRAAGDPAEARRGTAPADPAEARSGTAPADPAEPGRPSHDVVGDLIGTRGRIAVGVVFFVLYTLTFGLRGNLLAGLVGGALGGVVFFLLLKEAEERRRRRHRGQ
jgi:hypothetical protein